MQRRPGIYIPSLYFAEGLPYTVVMSMAGVFFKSTGSSNLFIGYLTLVSLPWTLKFIWAPMVDLIGTKKNWILISQAVLSLGLLSMSLIAFLPHPEAAGTALLALIALASATHDVAIDGYYLEVLNADEQAFFVGIRNAFYKIAWLFASGFLVFLAGKLGNSAGLEIGWAAAFALASLSMAICAIFHYFYLPTSKSGLNPNGQLKPLSSFNPAIILSYFKQEGIVAIVAYILLFRLGDALLLKQAPNFLLDPPEKGGLGISVENVGIIYGTVGVFFLFLGGILGGWLLSKYGLKRCFWPTAILQNSAIILYYFLAIFKPSILWLYVVNSFEQFAYGMGVAAYTVFLLRTVHSQYKASHYAVATALMSLGVLVPGTLSGALYDLLGYANFFLLSFLCSIPGIIAIFFLPLWKQSEAFLQEGAKRAI